MHRLTGNWGQGRLFNCWSSPLMQCVSPSICRLLETVRPLRCLYFSVPIDGMPTNVESSGLKCPLSHSFPWNPHPLCYYHWKVFECTETWQWNFSSLSFPLPEQTSVFWSSPLLSSIPNMPLALDFCTTLCK